MTPTAHGGSVLARSCGDGVHLWHIPTARSAEPSFSTHVTKPPGPFTVLPRPHGEPVLVTARADALRLWSTVSGNQIGEITREERRLATVRRMVVVPMNEARSYLVLAGSSGAIQLLELTVSGQKPTVEAGHSFFVQGHRGSVTAMVPIRLAKGRRPGLVTGGDTTDHTVGIWDLESMERVHRIDMSTAVPSLAVLPDGGLAIAGYRDLFVFG